MAISLEKGGNSVSSWPLMDPLSLIFGEPFRNTGRLKKTSFCQSEAPRTALQLPPFLPLERFRFFGRLSRRVLNRLEIVDDRRDVMGGERKDRHVGMA